MRALVTAVVVAVALAPSGAAKAPDFFALTLAPGASDRGSVCGSTQALSRAAAGARVKATIRMRATSAQRAPFVVAIRRCRAGHVTTIRRIRVVVPASKRAATVALPNLAAGEYRVEALLNGDRPPPASAIRHLAIAADGRPRILAVAYGRFRPRGASEAYNALRLRMLDPDGQVVGMDWTQVSPPTDGSVRGNADGGCGLGTQRDGAVGTWYLPMDLAPGSYRFEFNLTSSACAGGPGKPETARQTVAFDVP